jgi:hypothetical protein
MDWFVITTSIMFVISIAVIVFLEAKARKHGDETILPKTTLPSSLDEED